MNLFPRPSVGQLRDHSEQWLRKLGFEVKRQTGSWWTVTKVKDDGVIDTYRLYVRAVPKQEHGHDDTDFHLGGYKKETQDQPDQCVTGERSTDGRIEAWLVAWYRVDNKTGEAGILLTLGLRQNLDEGRKYRTVVQGRPLDSMQAGDYLDRILIPLGKND